MKWFALLLGILLAVAIYTIINQEARYVEMRAYAVHMWTVDRQHHEALNKCVRNSYRNL